MDLIDTFGRKINYLRLSVTDRCNMRCRYCMPAEGVKKLHRNEILSYDDMFRIVQSAIQLGIRKVRITGGEPLVRKGILGFISRISGMAGLEQLVLTTNGLLLEGMADELKTAGVKRLNISQDSMKHDVFTAITNGADLSRVSAGIDAAEKAGFPIKINMVVMRGINDEEVVDFAEIAMRKPFTIRFIEYMPAIKETNWQALVVPSEEILARIGRKFDFSSVPHEDFAGPAREFRLAGGIGTIGVISPITRHFCANCNRIRVTSTGVAKGCLFSAKEEDLKPGLRTNDRQLLLSALHRVVTGKPDKHGLTESIADHSPFSMGCIGG